MFKKKVCGKCGKKVNESSNFCPNCGLSLQEKSNILGGAHSNILKNASESKKDLGMLGSMDEIPNLNNLNLPLGLNTIFKTLVKNLDSQFQNLDQERNSGKQNPKKMKLGGISINISTSKNMPPVIKINSMKNNQNIMKKQPIQKQQDKIIMNNFSQEKFEKMASLKKIEPETKVRRLSDKIIYEIEISGVKSMEDILILQLKNSIEIKAIAEDKAYTKIIPISLPIAKYELQNKKLILELKS